MYTSSIGRVIFSVSMVYLFIIYLSVEVDSHSPYLYTLSIIYVGRVVFLVPMDPNVCILYLVA